MNSIEKGNAFRDLVAKLLRAAGFRANTEVKINYKNVDIEGIWERDMFGDPVRYAVEAKHYEGNLPLPQCTQFAADYGSLTLNGEIDHAWLVSSTDFTPDGRNAAQSGRNLKAFTFAELQRRLLKIDRYLHDLVQQYDESELGNYYISPETCDGNNLETTVRTWLDEKEAPPLFVLAPYGRGKTTFARHLAATMAREALNDPLRRVPLLFPLGEIVNEQSLDGLFGKVLASQHRVENYHYETVRELNRLGRFLIIYDGFDEMKHGMTIDLFQQVMTELMKVDEGDSRVLVLGRDTAFHDDHEFRLIVEGKQRTTAGLVVPVMDRRPYRHVELRGFTTEESHRYVRNYFPVLVKRAATADFRDRDWIDSRIAELLSGRFDDLLQRPVHAEMLCQIALSPDTLNPEMTVSELYETFVHYLLQRELAKPGRHSGFPMDIRRKFNSRLAWWLWERGGASTTTLNDIPQALCDDAAREVDHSMQKEELRRELIQGCLVEKGGTTIYFGHRSLQEFLVADYLIETNLLQSLNEKPSWLTRLSRSLTPEVSAFILGSIKMSPERSRKAQNWFQPLNLTRVDNISSVSLDFFYKLWIQYRPELVRPSESVWTMWLEYCLRAERGDFLYRSPFTVRPLHALFEWSSSGGRELDAAAMMVVAHQLLTDTTDALRASIPLAAALPISAFSNVIKAAQSEKSSRQIVRRDENYRLWSLLRAWKISQRDDGAVQIEINPTRILDDAEMTLQWGFSREGLVFDGPSLDLTPQQLYQAFSALDPDFNDKKLDAIRPFFNSENIRKRIIPVEVEHRKARQSQAVGNTPSTVAKTEGSQPIAQTGDA